MAISLSLPDPSSSRTGAGTIFVSLKPIEYTTIVGMKVDDCIEGSSRLTDGSELYQSIGRLFERVDTISKSIDDISEVSSHILPLVHCPFTYYVLDPPICQTRMVPSFFSSQGIRVCSVYLVTI